MIRTNFLTARHFLTHWANKSPDATALNLDGYDIDYFSFYEEVNRRAILMKNHGVRRDTICALYTDNEHEFLGSLFAVWSLGAVVVPININQKEESLRIIEKVVKPDIGFYAEKFELTFERPFKLIQFKSLNEVHEELQVTSIIPDELAMIMFTSGTSGVPKAVPMTHRAIARNAIGVASMLEISAEDRLLINTPPYTTSSIIHVLTMMSSGASTVVDRSFMFGAGIIEQISKHRCTGFGGVPVHFTRLSASLSDRKCPGSLSFFVNSGDHLPVPILKKILDLIPEVRFYCMYGLTEVAGRLCVLPADLARTKSGSVGKPINAMSVKIRGEFGEILGHDEIGQVYVNGPDLMTGYLNNQQANEKSFSEYGFATGDYGHIDSDGDLYLSGRDDDIFKVGAEKVSVKMIEDAVFGTEGLADFMVVPEYDEHLGNIPCLYYVLKDATKFDRKRLLSVLRQKLPHTHIPARFTQLENIPRTSSGKTIRKTHSK